MRQRTSFVLGFLVCIALTGQCSHAQYTANSQTNIISGVTSNWVGAYLVGYTNSGDGLLIENGGVLSNGNGYVGQSVSSNNEAVTTGSGSAWVCQGALDIGNGGWGNSLVISNGGQVHSSSSIVGRESSSNSVWVTGTGSVWSNAGAVTFGGGGGTGGRAGNQMTISNGGQVFSSSTGLGYGSSSSNDSVIVTDPGSFWSNSGSLAIGNEGASANSMVVSNGGRVADGNGFVGAPIDTSPGNYVLVTGVGSVWSNSGALAVGQSTSPGNTSNNLVITRGGLVISASGTIGSLANSNGVLVTDTGSLWSITSNLFVGSAGSANSLVISNRGQVADATAYVGNYLTGSSNTVRVVGGGVWQNNVLYVGYQGSSNSLLIMADQALPATKVLATNLIVGAASATCDNLLDVESGDLIVTNTTGTGVLEVRNGQLIVNGGLVRADTLVVTNPCASLLHTGGSLIVSNLVLDPNSFRITSITHQTNDLLITWMMGPGITNTLQVTTGAAAGSYDTNGFTDVVVMTNNAVPGTVTNYTDHGAATNGPVRYYRARLIP
jgi:fibronectin-binding autotransporter adhesin